MAVKWIYSLDGKFDLTYFLKVLFNRLDFTTFISKA